MADRLIDGSVQYGSRSITIDGTDYATDDFSVETASTQILRTDEYEVPSGRVTIVGETTGSATLQLAADGTAVPVVGDQFTETEGVFTIISVGRSESKGGETKVPVSFVKNITTTITSV
jgi:hypothetical protein